MGVKRKSLQEYRKIIEREGAELQEVIHERPHSKLVVEYKGELRKTPVPGTSKSWRALIQFRSDLRRWIRKVDAKS